MPGIFLLIKIEFNRPGLASILTIKEGILHL
jgi:hypothetical protein